MIAIYIISAVWLGLAGVFSRCAYLDKKQGAPKGCCGNCANVGTADKPVWDITEKP